MVFYLHHITTDCRSQMIHEITWANAHLHQGALYDSHRLRHKIFVDRTGYDVPTFDGAEYDQFDTPATVYLVHRGATGAVDGIARLVPTSRPYMIQELWPHLIYGAPPSNPKIWEGSRFGVDRSLPPQQRREVSRKLVAACQEFGLKRGIDAMIVLMPPFILRTVIEAAGCVLSAMGPVSSLGNIPVQAASVEISLQQLQSIRSKAGLDQPLLDAKEAQEAA